MCPPTAEPAPALAFRWLRGRFALAVLASVIAYCRGACRVPRRLRFAISVLPLAVAHGAQC